MSIIEPSHDPYQNLWYLVKKSTTGKYRLVNIAVKLSRVTVKDANLPPYADEFCEELRVVLFFLL